MDLSKLTLTGRWAVEEVYAMLAAGWTGEITLACEQGGVKHIRDGRTRKPMKVLAPARSVD